MKNFHTIDTKNELFYKSHIEAEYNYSNAALSRLLPKVIWL